MRQRTTLPEPVVRTTIKSILEREGFHVMPTDSPKAALEIVQATSPCLVITNVNLNGISGHDAMRMFKEGCHGTPVVMVSGLPDCETIRKWISENEFDAFPKPFSAKQLTEKESLPLRSVVKHYSTSDSTSGA